MNRSLARAAPVRFLIGVAAFWTMARGVALAGWGPEQAPQQPMTAMRVKDWLLALVELPSRPKPPVAKMPILLRAIYTPPSPRPFTVSRSPLMRPAALFEADSASLMPTPVSASSPAAQNYSRASGLSAVATLAAPPSTKHWSGSAWAFLRGGGRATALSPGQIGGGQAGARILYRLDKHLSAAARLSTAIGGARQTEAAFGLDWKPIDTVPIHLMAERRVAIDSGGRNAWTLGAAGGVDDVRIAPGWRLDGYGEAGVVGAHRRDLYADGAMRVARAIDLGHGKSLAIGGGVWGAAQPGASRLDIGPSIVLRLPVEHRAVSVALNWRERVLGHAKPGSGLALTVATDF